MRVKFWSGAAEEDGSVWYRNTMPAVALGWQEGWSAESSNMLTPLDQIRADVIVASRVGNPNPSELWRRLYADGRAFLVMDFDDDYLHLDPTNEPAYGFWSDPDTRNRLIRNIENSHRITCVSDRLATVLREFHDDVVVVPNGLHAAYLQPTRDYFPERVTLGWAGSSSTFHDFDLLVRALNNAQDTLPIKVKLVGTTAQRAASAGLRGDHVQGVEWVSPTTSYLQEVRGFDVWLAPYRSTPFNECKFPTKALEAGFHGIPLIASAIGPYRDVVQHGVTGFLVSQNWEWGKYINLLVNNPQMAREMGEAARSWACRYILQKTVMTWQRALTPPPVFTLETMSRQSIVKKEIERD